MSNSGVNALNLNTTEASRIHLTHQSPCELSHDFFAFVIVSRRSRISNQHFIAPFDVQLSLAQNLVLPTRDEYAKKKRNSLH